MIMEPKKLSMIYCTCRQKNIVPYLSLKALFTLTSRGGEFGPVILGPISVLINYINDSKFGIQKVNWPLKCY